MAERQAPAFLDTSVVVRYLTDDPPELAARAAEIVDSRRPLVLSEVCLVETAYVLTSVYEIPRDEAVEALMLFIRRRNLRLLTLPKSLALDALAHCSGSMRISFADAILWAEARHAGGVSLLTLDRSFPSDDLDVEILS